MKVKLVFLVLMLAGFGLQAQKLQVGVMYAPEFDYFQGRRIPYGFNYNVRLGAFIEANPIDRVGLRGSLFPSIYGATYAGGVTPFGVGVEQLNRIDLDISGELHYYLIEISGVTIKGIAGMLFPANVYEQVFQANQSFGRRNGINFLTPEIMLGPGISWNPGKNFNTIAELFYRRALDGFNRFSIATIEFRIGLCWTLLGNR